MLICFPRPFAFAMHRPYPFREPRLCLRLLRTKGQQRHGLGLSSVELTFSGNQHAKSATIGSDAVAATQSGPSAANNASSKLHLDILLSTPLFRPKLSFVAQRLTARGWQRTWVCPLGLYFSSVTKTGLPSRITGSRPPSAFTSTSRHPKYNKGLAFSDAERDRLYLRGLLPPAILSQDTQAERVMLNVRSKKDDLDKHTYLMSLQERNERCVVHLAVCPCLLRPASRPSACLPVYVHRIQCPEA
jgi:hypothetical protein